MTVRTLLFSLRAAAVAGVLFVVFAAAVPFLVEGQTIRRQLEDRLAEMTGGAVDSIGRVRLASFIALTVEAEDVKLRDITRLGPVSSIDARSVKAIIGFDDLLLGGLGFSKVILAGVDIRLAAGQMPKLSVDQIPDYLRLVLNAGKPPAGTIRIRDARLRVEGGPESGVLNVAAMQYEQSPSGRQSLRIQTSPAGDKVTFQMRAKPAPSGYDVSAALRGPGFDTAFAGRIANDGQTLAGTVHLAVSDPAAFEASAGSFALRPLSIPADISGALNFVNGGWSLENAALRLGRSNGAGYLNLRSSGGRLVLDGTVSWSVLNLNDVRSLFESVRGPEIGTVVEGDLRVSADRVEGLPLTLGSAAAAVSWKQGKLIADIAEVVVHGGTARGRIEAALAHGQILALGATVEDVSLRDFASALGIEAPLAGVADIGADLRMAANDDGDAGGFDALVGSLRIALQAPATIPAALSNRIADAFGAAIPPLSLPVPLSLDAIKLDATLATETVDFRLAGEVTGGGQILGSGTVNRSGRQLQGEIEVHRPSLLAAALSPPGAGQPSRIILGGSLGQIEFSAREADELSN